MYTFVLKWTPALTPEDATSDHSIPHGVIFASFMVSFLVQSFSTSYYVFKKLVQKFGFANGNLHDKKDFSLRNSM